MERGVVKHVGVNPEGIPYGFIAPENGGPGIYFNQKGGLFVLVTGNSEARFGQRGDNLHGCTWHRSPFPEQGQFVVFIRRVNRLGPKAESWCEERHFQQLTRLSAMTQQQ